MVITNACIHIPSKSVDSRRLASKKSDCLINTLIHCVGRECLVVLDTSLETIAHLLCKYNYVDKYEATTVLCGFQ